MYIEPDRHEIWITFIEDVIDAYGVPCLSCKGYVAYKKKVPKSGKLYTARGFIPSIRLYGDPELFDETKRRLWEQTDKYPKLKLHMITADFEVYSKKANNKWNTYYNLYVLEYDFPKNKYGTKRKNKAKAKAELKRSEAVKELEAPSEFEL